MYQFVPNKLLKKLSRYQVTETGLSNFHKMNLTVLKKFFTKQKYDTIFYRNYKELDNLKFKKALNRELMKHDLNNIDYKFFMRLCFQFLMRMHL